jgi:hypothetical protein
MNREDNQFWTGFLKGVLACEYEVSKAKQGEELKEIMFLEQKVKQLHTEDILVFLSRYEVD